MEKAPYMPFYGNDFNSSVRVARLSLAHQGLYIRLLWWQWQEGSIPDDVEEIVSVLGKPDEVRAAWPKVSEFFTPNNGCRINARLEEHRDRLGRLRSRNMLNGRGREARPEPNKSQTEAKPKPNHEPNRSQTEAKPQAKPKPTLELDWIGSIASIPSIASIESIKNQFNEYNEPPSSEVVTRWIEAVGLSTLQDILARYPDKGVAYIAKVVESKAREQAKVAAQMNVGAQSRQGPREEMLRRIEAWEESNPRPINPAMKGDWLAAFNAHFGFDAGEWNFASDAQIEEWLGVAQ